MNCGMEMQSKHGRRSSNKTKKQMHYRNWVFSEIEHKSMSGDKHRRSCIALHVIVNIGTCEHHECCRLRIVVCVCVCGATQKTRCEQPLREFFFCTRRLVLIYCINRNSSKQSGIVVMALGLSHLTGKRHRYPNMWLHSLFIPECCDVRQLQSRCVGTR